MPSRRFSPITTAALLALASPAFAQRDLKDIPTPDPELERQTFKVADGFEVTLWAGDDLLAKPIQMNFDPQGRLWVASSEVYPQIKPGQVANDKILVLEDGDGDGTADKTTVFADGLLIPTAVEPGDGGTYVGNSTELLHIRDTDGDGKGDERRIVLSGFGTEDTHHILHTLRWGPEGLLYFNQSIYIHSHIETPYGVRRLGGGGIWQFRPETLRLEVYARGWWNAWGHHFDQWGQSFVTDGAGGEGINYLVPDAAYPAVVGVPRILNGLNPGSPKYCGLEVVDGRHLPDDWQGSLITNDFRGHRVCRFTLEEQGSGYIAKQRPDLISSSHVAFRPIDVKMGPDGAIYIADWYNPIIQHGEVDFRDERRDHTHGRIWRVAYKGRPLVDRPQLAGASIPDLLAALKAPEAWTRHQAKRVLKEQALSSVGQASNLPGDQGQEDGQVRSLPHEILTELATWLGSLDPSDPRADHHRLEALWLHQALDAPNAELLTALLASPDHHVRAAATRVVWHWQDRLPNALGLLARQVADEHPQVRLEAVCALRKVPDPRAAEIALQALDLPVDTFLDYALWQTARELSPHWLPLVQSGKLTFGGNARHLAFALQAAGSPAVVPSLIDLVRQGQVAAGDRPSVFQIIALLGQPADLRFLFERAMDARADAAERHAALANLADATRTRNQRPDGDLSPLAALLSSADAGADLRSAAARTSGLWKLEAARWPLAELARDARAETPLRRAAIDGLADLGGESTLGVLRELARRDADPAIRTQAVTALAALDPPAAADLAVAQLRASRDGADSEPLINAFLQRKDAPAALAAKLEGQTLSEDAAKIALRAIESSGRKEPALEEALRKAGKITAGPKALTSEETAALVREVSESGDARRGETVFRRADLACFKCHAIGGAGGRVGPDLVSLGASAQVDYLIDSVLQPNKQVKENYHSLVVLDVDGIVRSGIKLRQTDKDLILRDAEDRELVIPLDAIDEQTPGASLMPAGLTDRLTRAELADLVRFLSELGRTEPFSVNPVPVVRRWDVLQPTPEAAALLRHTPDAAPEDPSLTWATRYSTVAGPLPPEELPPAELPMRPPVSSAASPSLGVRST